MKIIFIVNIDNDNVIFRPFCKERSVSFLDRALRFVSRKQSGQRHSIAASPEFQDLERMRAKAQHDEAQALYNERRKKKIETAKRLLGIGLPIDKIIETTGLTHNEIENLCDVVK